LRGARSWGRPARPLKQYLRDLARLQGWQSPLPESPVRIDARQIPDNFLDGFRSRDCASADCRACGYCERIAAKAVSVPASYRAEVLGKYAEVEEAMVAGGLWGIRPTGLADTSEERIP